MTQRVESRRWVVIAGLIALAAAAGLLGAIVGVTRLVRRSYADTQLRMQQMRRELVTFQPVAGAVLVGRDDSSKLGHGIVGGTYRTPASYPQIRKHYDEAAMLNGWTVACEYSLHDWGRDFGGREREYRKGPLRGSLQYAGADLDVGYRWAYAFELTSALRSRCK